MIDQTIGRYRLLNKLGEGGMAHVYRAMDTRLESEVALKLLRKEKFPSEALPTLMKRFEQEAKKMARLSHPNIVPVLDYGEHEGMPYFVMKHVAGGSLADRLKQSKKPMEWKEAVQLILPIARALAYAHQRGIIHRDVKPANILLTDSGEPMLSDFGVAKIVRDEETGTDLTGTGYGIGTPQYMALEQHTQKDYDHRVDQYALGVVLYEMVTGRKPFDGDSQPAILLKQIQEPLPKPRSFVPDLPMEVERVLVKALGKKPEERYSDMRAFIAALEMLVEVRPPLIPEWKVVAGISAGLGLVAVLVSLCWGLVKVMPVAAAWIQTVVVVPTRTPTLTPTLLPTKIMTKTIEPILTSTLTPSQIPTHTHTASPEPTQTSTPFKNDVASDIYAMSEITLSPRYIEHLGALDLNNDDKDELIVLTQPEGSEQNGQLVIFSWTGEKFGLIGSYRDSATYGGQPANRR